MFLFVFGSPDNTFFLFGPPSQAGARRQPRVPSALKAKTKQPPGKPAAPDSAAPGCYNTLSGP